MNDPHATPAPDAVGDIRAGIRAALAGELVGALEEGGLSLASTEVVANLAAAYASLGGALELDAEARAPALGELKAELETLRMDRVNLELLRAAVAQVLEATSDLSPDDFTPRLEHLVIPLERLAVVAVGGTYVEAPADAEASS